MFEHLDHDEDIERCGLFLKDRTVTGDMAHTPSERPYLYVGVVVELPNRHPNKRDNFRLAQDDIDQALEWLGRLPSDILGFWHTHTKRFAPGPSDADWEGIALGDRDWWHAVYSLDTRELTWFDYYDNEHSHPDKGTRRPYKRVQHRARESARRRLERR